MDPIPTIMTRGYITYRYNDDTHDPGQYAIFRCLTGFEFTEFEEIGMVANNNGAIKVVTATRPYWWVVLLVSLELLPCLPGIL